MRHLTQSLYNITKPALLLAFCLSVLSLMMNTMPVHAQTRSDAITELKRRLQERLANGNPAPRAEKAAERAEPQPEAITEQQAENSQEDEKQRKTAIVGSWLGTSGEGNKLINSFTSDGIITGSVQSEVSTIPELGVLTPAHGVWKYLGGRRFSLTAMGILYDINTGHLLGFLKAQPVLTINRAGDELSGTDKVEVLDPDGNVVFTATGETHYKRIKFESVN